MGGGGGGGCMKEEAAAGPSNRSEGEHYERQFVTRNNYPDNAAETLETFERRTVSRLLTDGAAVGRQMAKLQRKLAAIRVAARAAPPPAPLPAPPSPGLGSGRADGNLADLKARCEMAEVEAERAEHRCVLLAKEQSQKLTVALRDAEASWWVSPSSVTS
eukprot:193044-Prorocentrum_minimum.AAC.2